MGVLKILKAFVFIISLTVICFQALPCFSSFVSFVFGDSLVDAGNNGYILTLSKADSPPYGIDFRPSRGQPTGRFTNGRTIADIVGQALGAQSFPPPYLAPSTQRNSIFGGVNYASGASGILDKTGFLFIGRVPLRKQVNNFEKSRNTMVRAVGADETRKFLKNAIFSLTIGSNDIINYVQPSIHFLGEEKVSPSIFLDFMVSNLTVQLERLHELGARKFIVAGIGPLGCIPFVRALKLLPKGSCSYEVNELIQSYNMKLKQLIVHLNQELGPEAIFVYSNSYDVFLRIILNYHRYGFEDADEPCCRGYLLPFVCFNGHGQNSTSYLCEDRSKYVFWDAYHPTEAANVIVAKEFLDGNENISFPINIRELYNRRS